MQHGSVAAGSGRTRQPIFARDARLFSRIDGSVNMAGMPLACCPLRSIPRLLVYKTGYIKKLFGSLGVPDSAQPMFATIRLRQ